jgi:anti-sigma-K factor RskA
MSDELRDNCGDAASYVLGALGDPEHDAFLEHLSTCSVCREEVASLEIVVSSLPSAVPQFAAPAHLKDRVMNTVTREARAQEAARGESRAEVSSPRRREWFASWRPALGGIATAAALVVVAILAFSTGGSGTKSHVFKAQVTAPRASASVRVSGSHADLTVADMPQSPSGHVYEVWIKRAGNPQPTDALFTVSNSGSATVGVPGDIKGVTEILVTAEPLGGSRVPTSKPVIIAPLA